MPARPRRALPLALALSALAHSLALAPFVPALWRARAAPPPPDVWVGGGSGGDEVSVELGADAAPAVPAAAPAADAAPATVPAADAARAIPPGQAAPIAPSKPAARRESGGHPAARTRPAGAGREAATSGPGAGEPGEARGAGVAAAASPRDLGRAFTRAIAPGSQADRAWSGLPAGWTGALEVVLELDASGSLAGFEVIGDRAPAPLRELVRRTTVLLRGGIFAPRGVTPGAGKVRLKLRARTLDVDPAAVAGGSIDLEFSFENGKGRATFTQAGGRRVNVDVEAAR